MRTAERRPSKLSEQDFAKSAQAFATKRHGDEKPFAAPARAAAERQRSELNV